MYKMTYYAVVCCRRFSRSTHALFYPLFYPLDVMNSLIPGTLHIHNLRFMVAVVYNLTGSIFRHALLKILQKSYMYVDQFQISRTKS